MRAAALAAAVALMLNLGQLAAATVTGDPCSAIRVHRESLAGGDAGIYRTVRVMRQLIKENRGHPVVRAHAEAAVTGLGPLDPIGELAAVRDYVGARVQYRRDPTAVEWLQAPWMVLACQIERGSRPQLDCDDLTDLSLAMLEAVGHETTIIIVSQRPDRQFNHVYGGSLIRDTVVPLDLVELWRPAGARAPRETRRVAIETETGKVLPLEEAA